MLTQDITLSSGPAGFRWVVPAPEVYIHCFLSLELSSSCPFAGTSLPPLLFPSLPIRPFFSACRFQPGAWGLNSSPYYLTSTCSKSHHCLLSVIVAETRLHVPLDSYCPRWAASGQCGDRENQQSWPGACPASAPPATLCSRGWIAGQTQKRHLNGFLVPFPTQQMCYQKVTSKT